MERERERERDLTSKFLHERERERERNIPYLNFCTRREREILDPNFFTSEIDK